MDTRDQHLSILVVEDNDDLRESMLDALGSLGHHVQGVDAAEALYEDPGMAQVDLFIIDINLPGENGLSLAGRLRESQPGVGIIMLTARTRGEDRTAGYQHGADIYLTKPASLDELCSAIQALTRRLVPPATSQGLQLDTRLLTCRDAATQELVSLTSREAALLSAFVRAPGQQLEHWQVAERLGLNLKTPNKSAIEVHVSRLRKKLAHFAPGGTPIKVVRSHGYQLTLTLHLT